MEEQRKTSISAFLLLLGFLMFGGSLLVTDLDPMWQFIMYSITAAAWELEVYLANKWGLREVGMVSYETSPALNIISEVVWHALILGLPATAFVNLLVNG